MMENNVLISMWHNINAETRINYHVDSSTLKMKHSKIFSRLLFDQKLKIIMYLLFFMVYLGLMIYAYLYLGLNLSVYSNSIFSAIGVFFVYKILSETGRYKIFVKTSDNLPIKESAFIFLKRIKRIVNVDFITFILLIYSLATMSILLYIRDIGGINNISLKNEMGWLLLVFVFIALYIPWFLRYIDMRKYKKINLDMKDLDF